MAACRRCFGKILSHSLDFKCSICFGNMHRECIPLTREEFQSMKPTEIEWICTECSIDIYPFNHYDEENMFMDVIEEHITGISNISSKFSDKIFMPLELQEFEQKQPLFDIDPELHFFNEINGNTLKNSEYYTEGKFIDKNQELFKDSNIFSLFHANVRSLPLHLNEFTNIFECLQFQFTVIGFTETWLSPDNNEDLYGLPGYAHIGKHRSVRIGGGVSIFIKENIPFIARTDLDIFNETIESVFIEIDKDYVGRNKNIIIGVLYRPPDTDVHIFSSYVSDIQDKIKRQGRICYLMGDYNIDLLKCDNHLPTTEFMDTMYGNSYINLINRPTRVTSKSATIIDNIFTNNFDANMNSFSGILTTDITDHFSIFHVFKSNICTTEDAFYLTRKFSQKNKELFKQSIDQTNWDELLPKEGAQISFTLFHRHIISLYDKAFPVVRIKRKYNNRKPWLTEALRQTIHQKNKLFLRHKNRPTLTNEILYKRHRNNLKKILISAEKRHFQHMLEMNKNNLQKTWKMIKNIINKNSAKKIQKSFKVGNNIIDDPTEICEKI